MWRPVLLVLELEVGDEDEAGVLEPIEGEEACGVDLVPQFKHADVVAEAELTLARILCLQLFQTAACWKANPHVRFKQFSEPNTGAEFGPRQRQNLQKIAARL